MADCPITPWTGREWADVVELAEERKADLEKCNEDKAAIRKAVEEARKAYE